MAPDQQQPTPDPTPVATGRHARPAAAPCPPDWFTPPRSLRHDLPAEVEANIPHCQQPGESTVWGFARALVAETCGRLGGRPVQLSVNAYYYDGTVVAATVFAPERGTSGYADTELDGRMLFIEVHLGPVAGEANWALVLGGELVDHGSAVGEPAPALLADLLARNSLRPGQLPDARG